uniref:PDZ domain-containing protein n=1 Tax=Romanomermis culicivorax TaxID=13658 RepID=A0A915I874_ROMCU
MKFHKFLKRMHFIDALENVSEAEMLKKLEETILSGSLPVTSSSTAARPTTPRPPPKPLNPPFPLTNTILKHPYSNKTVGGADGSSPVVGAVRSRDILGGAGSILLTGHFSSSSPGPVGSRQSILSGYENIPLITSPINADLRTPNDPGESHSHDDSNDTSPGDEDECLREMPPLETSSLASRLAAGFRDNTDLSTGILRNRTLPSAAPSSSLYSKNSSPIGQGHGAGPGLPLEFYRVTLLKDTTYNDFGFSVSDGVAEKGIFINKVRPKGPADFSGNIRPYDKLLQVNDTSLKDLDCLLAVPILAAAGDKIDLFICRDPNLILNRRPESIEEEDEEDDQQQQQQKIMQRLTPEQTQV